MSDKNNINNENPNNNETEDKQNYYLGAGIGLVLGAALGVIFDNIAIGAGLGMLIGICTGGIIVKNKKDVKWGLIKVVLIAIVGVILVSLVPKIIDYLW